MDTISRLSARIDAGEVSAVALLDESLARIDRLDGDLRAFITVLRASARRDRKHSANRCGSRRHDNDQPVIGLAHG